MSIKLLFSVVTVCVLGLPLDTVAQTSAPAVAPGGNSGPEPPAVPQFGAWLDDASLEGRGTARVTLGSGYWRSADGNQVDVPMIDVGYDVSNRVQASAFVPFYRARYGADVTTGLDDVYVNTKVVLAKGANSGGRFGLAVSPALEVLNSNAATGSRMHWILPISAEVRVVPRFRIYGSVGYFSRGAAFGGVAAEWTAPTDSIVWAAVTSSFALEAGGEGRSTSDRHLTNAVAGITQIINAQLAAYMSISRTISWTSSSSAIVGIGGGISIRVQRPKAAD